MTDFVSGPALQLSDPRARRRAPAPRIGSIIRRAATAWLKARARRRDYARLADMPDEILKDAGLLDHPDIVRLREMRRMRARDLFGGGH